MANHLDLEEQEQLDQLKHFWKQYGNFITWVLIAVLGSFAAWNGYQYWERSRAAQAAALFDEVEKVVRAGDLEKAERAFSDMKERFGSTVYAQQAGLLVGKMAFDATKLDSAKTVLTWVSEHAEDKAYAAVAKLRLSAVLIEGKEYDQALKTLSAGADTPDNFVPLLADRRGDVYALQGKVAEAKTEYQTAFKKLDAQSDYRRLVEVKLNALGVSTETSKEETAK
jgi:predicted negative regulator of RcsB-dependent stress response